MTFRVVPVSQITLFATICFVTWMTLCILLHDTTAGRKSAEGNTNKRGGE